MNAESRRKIEMGTRALAASRARVDTDPGYAVAEARLEQFLTRAAASATAQRDGLIDARASSARKLELRRVMLAGPIAHLAEVGRMAAAENHELGTTFRFKPATHTYLAFRTAARGMAEQATAARELLGKYGMSESVLVAFGQLLDQFDAAVALGDAGRTAHTASTAELRILATEIARTVRVMDARNRQRFADDPRLLGSWINASTVLGTPRRGAGGEEPASEPAESSAPAATQEGTPADGGVRPAA